MCVIGIADKERITEEMISLMFEANPEGAGIAWREDGFVRWKKGLDLEEIQNLCKTLPLPYVAHFRIASMGGKRDALCHPFPINKQAPLALAGKTKGYVLFHNGHWTRWNDVVLEACLKSNTPVPPGKWSDTRGMAFVAAVYGLGMLELINEKSVAFGPADVEVTGTGWAMVNKVWCSNKFWENRRVNQVHEYPRIGYVACRHAQCKINRFAQSEYCYEHQYLDKENELPVIDAVNIAKDIADKRAVGGGPKLLPFAEADRLFKMDPPQISKKQWKKARKRDQEMVDKLFRQHQKQLKKEQKEMVVH